MRFGPDQLVFWQHGLLKLNDEELFDVTAGYEALARP